MSSQPTHHPQSNSDWGDCTFEGAEAATLRQGAALTFAEKIAWLEQAHRISMQFQVNRQKQGLPTLYQNGRVEK